MSKLDLIYARLPLPLQHQAITAYGLYWHWLRFGGGYKAHELAYRSRDHFNADQWTEFQQGQLRNLIRVASEHVPYYQRTWNQQQVKDAMAGNLSALPLLEKESDPEDPIEFVRSDMPRVALLHELHQRVHRHPHCHPVDG